MRKKAYIHNNNVADVVKRLIEADVPDIYLSDDRGGTGSWVVIAQGDFLPALTQTYTTPEYEWHNAAPYDGHMPEEDEL